MKMTLEEMAQKLARFDDSWPGDTPDPLTPEDEEALAWAWAQLAKENGTIPLDEPTREEIRRFIQKTSKNNDS